MSLIENDIELLCSVQAGNIFRVKAALEAGANIDGSQDLPRAPIIAAVLADDAEVLKFLLNQGADPDKRSTEELPYACPSSGAATNEPGERALHIAARSGKIDMVRLLLNGGQANVNATDNRGWTPLMTTCIYPNACVEVVRLLLEAGADPALTEDCGHVPMHMVARSGDTGLVDMLHTAAPAALNRCAARGETPLFLACAGGHESMVSKLLSLGAVQEALLDEIETCPLVVAVRQGLVNVVGIIISEGGTRAVGGDLALGRALHLAVAIRQTRILQLLLAADGKERRSKWANTILFGKRLLHVGARYCCLAEISVLLEAGADEAARDTEGYLPRDATGSGLGPEPQMNREREAAVRRMLRRGPAYRARSWAWPSDEETDVGGSGNDDTAAAAVLSPPPEVKTLPVIGVRLFRPNEKNSSKLFVRLMGRYCAKD